jgi:hypothetical protein
MEIIVLSLTDPALNCSRELFKNHMFSGTISLRERSKDRFHLLKALWDVT